jgi:GT2 family glycosyltransferase
MGRSTDAAAPDASVIIPTFNGARWLEACLSSLRRQTAWGRFEVIVVDDGSTDGTADVLRRFEWVRVVRNPVNRGFARSVNAGIRQGSGAVTVVLNNDTEADPRWLEELLAALHVAGHSGPTGMATSKILTMADRRVLHTTGDTVSQAGVPANRGVWEEDRGQWDEVTDVFGASGAAAAYTRGMLETIGLFEERFESYLEDVDLAWRARLAGFGCVFAPRAVVFHGVSSTGGGRYASFRVGRNRVWLLVRNYPSGPFRRHWREIVGALFAVAWDAVRHFRGEEARATLLGILTGIVTSPAMLTARRDIQRRRVIDDAAFEALLGGGR